MQLILFIILAVFSGMALVGIGFFLGYLFGKQKDEILEMHNTYLDQPFKKEVNNDSQTETNSNEPSGIVMRPTPQELKKMNEDTQIKQAKEALKETFDNEPEPKI
jgi:hypothetical protein